MSDSIDERKPSADELVMTYKHFGMPRCILPFQEMVDGINSFPTVGPGDFTVAPQLPPRARTVTVDYTFLEGSQAEIWPMGEEARRFGWKGYEGECELPVNETGKWILRLPAGTSTLSTIMDYTQHKAVCGLAAGEPPPSKEMVAELKALRARIPGPLPELDELFRDIVGESPEIPPLPADEQKRPGLPPKARPTPNS